MGDLAGQVAIVTGAAGGIGRAVADALHDAGAATCYLDIHVPDDVAGLDGRERSLFTRCDVGDEEQVDVAVTRCAETLGAPSLLVNNAGIVVRSSLEETTRSVWHDTIRTNLTGAYLMARRVLPAMRGAGYGRLVHLTSMVAETGGSGDVAAYAASKAGLTGLARAIAVEYAGTGVTSNVVAPAWIDAGMFAVPDARPERVPVGRLGTSADVVAAVRYLASPAAGFFTGQVMHVNGGLYLG